MLVRCRRTVGSGDTDRGGQRPLVVVHGDNVEVAPADHLCALSEKLHFDR
jgi:hypothetical protein